MVVQAIALLDDLDKEINIYAMRVKVRLRCQFMLAARLLTLSNPSGMVRMAFPRNGQNSHRQPRLCQSRTNNGYIRLSFIFKFLIDTHSL